jgi:predicted Zn-dependent protease with MMP-like domain
VSADPNLQAIEWATGVFCVFGVFVWFLKRDADQFAQRAMKLSSPGPAEPGMPSNEWEQLVDRAIDTVKSSIAELPDDVRAEAEAVPVLFEERSENEQPGQTILGIYRGFVPHQVSVRKGPIVLYLRSIEAYAGPFAGAFENQVRRTFLHELGHHLGWGEADVRARGL